MAGMPSVLSSSPQSEEQQTPTNLTLLPLKDLATSTSRSSFGDDGRAVVGQEGDDDDVFLDVGQVDGRVLVAFHGGDARDGRGLVANAELGVELAGERGAGDQGHDGQAEGPLTHGSDLLGKVSAVQIRGGRTLILANRGHPLILDDARGHPLGHPVESGLEGRREGSGMSESVGIVREGPGILAPGPDSEPDYTRPAWRVNHPSQVRIVDRSFKLDKIIMLGWPWRGSVPRPPGDRRRCP